ncbi:hypothetical protein K469DRAFT_103660 [Zopfia rhizophila CBS 207.26]|uniref:DUF6594 domain-containing protein n=1 Tax=Zopfia rhizophila CBS 207.26 TaxID=1314779 RepID=A0A6A6E755_9PEZI|nr:hypothetical protein K469DRAFT_103660 [Zopfia rhizophila CBS 207.26]
MVVWSARMKWPPSEPSSAPTKPFTFSLPYLFFSRNMVTPFPNHLPSLGPAVSPADLMRALAQHHDLYNDAARHPEADIRRRFAKERVFRAAFVEWIVDRRFNEVTKLRSEFEKEGGCDEIWFEKFETSMWRAIEALELCDRVFTGDRRMAQSITPSAYYMDLYRAHLQSRGHGVRAPNGQDQASYGPRGGPISDDHTALCDENLSPVQWFLVYKLMNPFIDYISDPLQKMLAKVWKPNGSYVKQQEINESTIRAIAKTIECALGNLSLSAAIGILYKISSPKVRLVVLTVFSLVFSSSVNLFGREAIQTFALTAG